MSIVGLQWAIGGFCATLGTLMLVAPHEFATPSYAALQGNVFEWGLGFGVTGSALFALVALRTRFGVVLLVHACAAALLLLLAVGFASTGSWTATTSYVTLGVGTIVAPLLVRRSAWHSWLHGDFFSFAYGVGAVLTGLILLGLPDQFNSPTYDTARPYLSWYGVALAGLGVALCLRQTSHLVTPSIGRWVPVFLAGTFVVFGTTTTPATAVWTGILFYGGLGVILVLLSWLEPRLWHFDPRSLRTRLALVLAAAAAVPLLILVPLDAREQERQAVVDEFDHQEGLATALAQDVDDYVRLHQAALQVLAGEPGLLALSPGEQHTILQNSKAAYPDVAGFGTVGPTGEAIARADDRSGTSWVGDPVFEDARATGQPSMGIRISPVTLRLVFSLGVPILDDGGKFAGMVSASLESSRLAALITRADFGQDAHAYLVDARGEVIAHPDPLVANLADLSATPSVAAFLVDTTPSGSLRVVGAREELLVSYARVPDLDWGILIERPSASSLGGTHAKLDVLFGGLIVSIAAAAGLGVLAAGWLSEPLGTLGAAVDSLATGDSDAPLPTSGFTEVASLAAAFATMRERLAARTIERERAEAALRESDERVRIERHAADKMKDEFISIVSHELRTPLTSIRGSLGLLAAGLVGAQSEKAQRMLDIAASNSERLLRLINDLLDLERIQSDTIKMRRVACNLTELMTQAADSTRGMAVNLGVILEVQPLGTQLWGDPDRLVQVMTNLLSNAVKYSVPGGSVTLTARQDADHVIIMVADSGRGIPADKLDSIFERFEQVDASSSRQKGGTGLGLAISRSIAHQHAGRIWVESTLGVGSTFFVSLPTRTAQWPVEKAA